jgi:hypothetical protein
MAEREFYNGNERIAYPLVARDLPITDPFDALVDAGFMVGPAVDYDPTTNNVYLFQITVSGASVIFDFRSDATELMGYRWFFTAPAGTAYGCTISANVELALVENEIMGYGFITIGHLDRLIALGDGTYTMSPVWNVEPALVQSLRGSRVERIILANDARPCPVQCNPASSSSSSSSSSSASSEQETYLVAGGELTGDVKFKGGFNCDISLLVSSNAVEIGANRDSGDGKTCYDWIIDQSGMHKDPDSGVPYCEACAAFISTINGRNFNATGGKVRLNVPAGALVTPDKENHRITIRLKPY